MRDRPNEKIRDMSRSVLPSKARIQALRTKQNLHRSARRRSRMLMGWLDDLDGDDFKDSDGIFYGSEDDYRDLAGELRSKVSMMVRDRRDADKLGGFLRWAKDNTKNIKDNEDKYYALKKKIGSSVIKDHALGHFIQLDSARNPFYFKSILNNLRKIYAPCPWKTKNQLFNWIREAIELHHWQFNDFLYTTGFKIAPPHTCHDDESKLCWVPVFSNRHHHNDGICEHKGMVQCLAFWRKLHTSQVYPDRPCWRAETVREHQESKCPNSRSHVRGVEEVNIVCDYFWNENHYKDEMDLQEKALAKFFRLRGILD